MTGRNEEWLITMTTIVDTETETSSSVVYNDDKRSVRSFNAPGSAYRYLKKKYVHAMNFLENHDSPNFWKMLATTFILS